MSDSDQSEDNAQSFAKARRRVFEKKGESCYICDRNREYSSYQDISVHHINGDDTDHRVDNLLPVCQKCHLRIHRRPEEPYKKWHQKLPEDKRHTSEDHSELFEERDKERDRDGPPVLKLSRRAAKVVPEHVEKKFEVATEEEANQLIKEWDDKCQQGTIYLKKAHPGLRDTEVTHVVCLSRN